MNKPCKIIFGENDSLYANVRRELEARGVPYYQGGGLPTDREDWLGVNILKTGSCARTSDNSPSPDGPTFDLTKEPLPKLLAFLDAPEVPEVKLEGARDVQVFRNGKVRIWFKELAVGVEMPHDDLDRLYAASQAARKGGK